MESAATLDFEIRVFGTPVLLNVSRWLNLLSLTTLQAMV